MAWIESHQELARHPKTRKLSRKLGISVPAAIGHLHLLWWWALDYAQDGNLSVFESEDVADAMEWPHESSIQLLTALVESEFVDNVDGNLMLHDWFDYAGRLVDKREQNRERKRKSRAKSAVIEGGHAPVTRPSQGQGTENEGSHRATVPNSTEPNNTIPNQTKTTTTSGGALPNPFRLFESEGFGTISSVIADRMNVMIADYGERWVCEAMKAAVVAGKRNLTYVDGILKRYQSEGVDEPWKVEKPVSRNIGNDRTRPGGKPKIDIVSKTHQSQPMSEQEIRELCDVMHRSNGKAPPSEEEYREFIAVMQGKEPVTQC